MTGESEQQGWASSLTLANECLGLLEAELAMIEARAQESSHPLVWMEDAREQREIIRDMREIRDRLAARVRDMMEAPA